MFQRTLVSYCWCDYLMSVSKNNGIWMIRRSQNQHHHTGLSSKGSMPNNIECSTLKSELRPLVSTGAGGQIDRSLWGSNPKVPSSAKAEPVLITAREMPPLGGLKGLLVASSKGLSAG